MDSTGLAWQHGAPLHRTTKEIGDAIETANLVKPEGVGELLRHLGKLMALDGDEHFTFTDILTVVLAAHNNAVLAFHQMQKEARYSWIVAHAAIENWIWSRATQLHIPLESAVVGRFRVIRQLNGAAPAASTASPPPGGAPSAAAATPEGPPAEIPVEAPAATPTLAAALEPTQSPPPARSRGRARKA